MAFDLAQRSADLGNANAMGNLGVFYMNGTGLAAPDPAKAVELFRQGAERDNPPSMFFYAMCQENGIGGPKNPAEARKWYATSAAKGHPPAVDWCKRNKVPVPTAGR